MLIDKKKINCHLVDFVMPLDHRLKIKESEKNWQIPEPRRRAAKMWIMKVTMIPIVIGALVWHDGEAFVSVGVGERQSEDFFCLLWTETHTRSLCARFPTRPEKDEERQGLMAINRKKELATVKERRWSQKSGCWARSWDLWTQRPGQRAREDVSVPSSCVVILFEYMHVSDTETQNVSKVLKTSAFLRLGQTQVHACLFFFLPLSIIYVASVVCL